MSAAAPTNAITPTGQTLIGLAVALILLATIGTISDLDSPSSSEPLLAQNILYSFSATLLFISLVCFTLGNRLRKK